MGWGNIITKPSQEHLLQNFSPMTSNNVNNIVSILALNELMRDATLDSDLSYENGIIPETISHKSFEIAFHSKFVDITVGQCIFKNVFVDITSSKSISVMDDNSYLYNSDGDVAPHSSGDYTTLICLQYIPTEETPEIYIGLINDFTYYTNHINDLIIVGFAEVTISGGVGTVILTKEEDSTSGLYRKNYDIIDSGIL